MQLTGSTCHVPASSFVPEIFPARTARRTVDLSKPQATAASARVYGMVVRLAAMKRARHGVLPSLMSA